MEAPRGDASRRRRPFGRSGRAQEDSGVWFAARLMLALAGAFALVGVLGYVLVADRLAHQQDEVYEQEQRAAVASFEAIGARSMSRAETEREVGEVLEATGKRPGVSEARLIDSDFVVRAAADEDEIGTRESGPRVSGALRTGHSFVGDEADPGEDATDHELVAPVDLPQGRYVYEVAYETEFLDAQIAGVRRTLLIVAVLGAIGGMAVFYLLAGRALLRDHRFALRRATRDGLTDLPNHRAFQDDLAVAVATASRHGFPLSLAAVDIDDFKLVNDRSGHLAGDALLRRTARVLRAGRSGDRAYRTGGDEFALVLHHTDREGAYSTARRLSRELRESGVAGSIGIGQWRHGQEPEALRAEADAALYEAKRRGGGVVAEFEDIRDDVEVTTTAKKTAVRALLDEGRLSTVLQPIYDLRDDRLLGVEALSRPDESYGLAGPAEAFDVAHQIGRVRELDVLCVRTALERAPELPDGTLLFLNVSPHSLDFRLDETDWLPDLVHAAGVDPERVVLEVTERFPRRTEAVVKTLAHLRTQGFQLALDDIGTGNSGLEVLRRIDAEFVKIDRTIVNAASAEPNARAVLMAMATFARQTGAFVIAEGIEDDETLEFLRGIDHRVLGDESVIQGGQGFGLGRPSPDMPRADALPADVRA